MKIQLKKLNAHGVSHLVLPLAIVVGLGVVGTYVLVASHADPLTSTGATAKAYTYQAKDMYGDGLGPITTASENGTTVQEFAKGSAGNLVNNTYSATLINPLNAWNKKNVGKKAQFCLTARSVGPSSRLTFNSNNGAPGTSITLKQSSTYKAYCSATFALTLPSASGNVTMTIGMQKLSWSGPTPKITGGPLRVQSAAYQLK